MAESKNKTENEIRALLTGIVLSDQLVKQPRTVLNYFTLIRTIFSNIVDHPKNYVEPISGGEQVLTASGFKLDEDQYYRFESADTRILKVGIAIITSALARIQSKEDECPPAYVPFLRRLSTMPPPPAPVLGSPTKTDRMRASVSNADDESDDDDEDAKARGLEILESIQKKMLMSEEEKKKAREIEEEQKALEEMKARMEQLRSDEETAKAKAEEIRQKMEFERLERMRKDWEAALRLQREEEEADKKRRAEAKSRREREEKKKLELYERRFSVGDEVVVHGLVSSTHLNGCSGKVQGQIRSDHRWPVNTTLTSGEVKLYNFKNENLKAKTYDMGAKEAETMARLMEMGFDASASRRAAMQSKGNLGKAIEIACKAVG